MFGWHIYIPCVHIWCSWKPEEGRRSSGTTVMDSREPRSKWRELNLDPLGSWQMLLAAEPSLSPRSLGF